MRKKNAQLFLHVLVVFTFHGSNLYAIDNQSIAPEDVIKMSFEEMLDIKITTATKKEDKIGDIPASTVIIYRSDIEKYGYRSLEEILENVPGMYVIDEYVYRKSFGVRGYYAGYPRNIIFLVNGIVQNESLFDYNVMSNFNIPVEVIDRIEVVRGPMSVIYGQGAFFGAINIITNAIEDETSLASFSVGDGVYKGAAKVTGTQEDWSYSLSAGYSDADGPDHSLDKMVSDMSTLAFWGIDDTNDTTEDRLERDSQNFIFSGKYKQFFTDMSFNKSTDEIFTFRPSVTGGSPYKREMLKLSVGYEDQITDKITLKGQITYHNFSVTLDWDITNSLYSGDSAGQTWGESDDFEYELDAFIDVSENLNLTTGLYLKQSKDTSFSGELPIFNVSVNSYTTDDRKLWAAFAQANYTPWEKLRLVGGMRVEQMEDYSIVIDNYVTGDRLSQTYDYDLEAIPSLAAIYTFNEHNIVKLLYGESIARASFFQNYDQLLDGYPVVEAEKIRTYELNYTTILSPKLTINCSLFHNVLDNLLVRTVIPEGSSLTEYLTNQGEIVTNGVEFTLQATPFDDLFTEVSLTYQDSEDQRDGFEDIDVAYSPHLLGYAKLAYHVSSDVIFSLTGTYVDEMEPEWDIRQNNYTGGRIGDTVDAYFLLGANLRVNNLFGTGCYLNIRGSNILDEEYHYPTYVSNTWADKGTLGDPMEFLVTLGVKF